MTGDLTIVMYHYVRELEKSRYPGIRGLRVSEFRNQLDYLQNRFALVSVADVVAARRAGEGLPPNAALLTFDDGYIEHFTSIFPILFERGLSAAFYPPVATIRNGQLLDVNRLHFILAVANPAELRKALDRAIFEHRDSFGLKTPAEYWAEWGVANRFDVADVNYFKRMLQTALPVELRHLISTKLFADYIGMDEQAFSAELYMNEEQARVMVACGMHFGSHGDKHVWLNRVDRTTQEDEIDISLEWLRSIGEKVDDFWTMAYPYGGWNESILEVLRMRKCDLAVTTTVGTADIFRNDPLLLPRYDTNDFPKHPT